MKTIFAPLNPLTSTVVLIRISGPEAKACLAAFKIKLKLKPRYLHYVKAYDQANHLLDEIIVSYFKAPNSFTGEEVIELAIHGGRANSQKFLKIIRDMPKYQYAEAGAFSKQGFSNGKIDLLQAEAINDLVKAETRRQAQMARLQMAGLPSHKLARLR